MQTELDLSDLFHPETFLGALRQTTSRAYGVSMDTLELVNSWDRSGVSGAKLSIRSSGIMLEGAMFDGQRLIASKHDAPTHATLPTCSLAWVPAKDRPSSSGCISLPLYFSSDREKILAMLDVPVGANGGEEPWLLAGAVLFLNSYI